MGYGPLAAYLGSHWLCLKLAVRPGEQHLPSETDFNLEGVIPMAQCLSAEEPEASTLVGKDSDFGRCI